MGCREQRWAVADADQRQLPEPNRVPVLGFRRVRGQRQRLRRLDGEVEDDHVDEEVDDVGRAGTDPSAEWTSWGTRFCGGCQPAICRHGTILTHLALEPPRSVGLPPGHATTTRQIKASAERTLTVGCRRRLKTDPSSTAESSPLSLGVHHRTCCWTNPGSTATWEGGVAEGEDWAEIRRLHRAEGLLVKEIAPGHQRRRHDQPRVGDQVRVVEGHLDPIDSARYSTH